MRRAEIIPKFVEFVPAELEEGTLYISIEYATSVHLCPCGCGNKVVAPISPPDWQLIYDGDSVSLHPSIGNWQFPCQSHYWIRRNQIEWAQKWSPEKIEAGRRRDAEDIARYYERRAAAAKSSVRTRTQPTSTPPQAREPLASRIKRLLHRHS